MLNANFSQFRKSSPKMKKVIAASMQFEHDMMLVDLKRCDKCHQTRVVKKGHSTCKSNCSEKRHSKKYCADNDVHPFWIDDKGQKRLDIPKCLQDLTMGEKLMIQKCAPIIPFVHVKDGKFGLKGHVCAVMQNVEKVCSQLPRMPSEINIVKVARAFMTKKGDVKLDMLQVRRLKVLQSLSRRQQL